MGWRGSNSIFNDISLYMYEEDISANEELKSFRFNDDISLVRCNDMKNVKSS